MTIVGFGRVGVGCGRSDCIAHDLFSDVASTTGVHGREIDGESLVKLSANRA